MTDEEAHAVAGALRRFMKDHGLKTLAEISQVLAIIANEEHKKIVQSLIEKKGGG